VLRIGNCSGFYGDRATAMHEMLTGGPLDVLTGDYLAELTMLILARDRARAETLGYAKTFLRQLETSLGTALERGVMIVANAGGLNPAGLAAAVRRLADSLGLDVSVAHVEGDDLRARAAEFALGEPLAANAYLGAFGIAECIRSGAQIVVTGRVTDASLVVGPAIAHFGWTPSDLDPLAGAVVAGHIIECGPQATGGNYAFFDEVPDLRRPGFPIAELAADGSAVITKHDGTGGAVSVGTVTAQLLYEIAGPRYPGPDVTARFDTIELTPDGVDRVRIGGVRGEPPPPTLKVGLNSLGGFRNEMTAVLTGLDIEAKAALFRRQMEAAAPDLEWTLARLDRPDAPTEQQASALFTVVARGADERVVGRAFADAAVQVALGSYPGFFTTTPPGRAHPYGVFTAGFVPQAAVAHEVMLPDGTVSPVEPPPAFQALEPLTGPDPERFERTGPSRRLPLGAIAGARSGDKGGNANVGVWVRTDDAYAWLAALLTEATIRDLLPEVAALPLRITCLPLLRAVNIVVEGLLGAGVAYNARFDPQAKGLGEWLRSRLVDIPLALLEEPT
jgi:hypothetical protein